MRAATLFSSSLALLSAACSLFPVGDFQGLSPPDDKQSDARTFDIEDGDANDGESHHDASSDGPADVRADAAVNDAPTADRARDAADAATADIAFDSERDSPEPTDGNGDSPDSGGDASSTRDAGATTIRRGGFVSTPVRGAGQTLQVRGHFAATGASQPVSAGKLIVRGGFR